MMCSLGCEVVPSRAKAVQSATDVMDKLLGELGFPTDRWTIASARVTAATWCRLPSSNMSEISCHGRGAHWLAPSVRTVIDGGGQDCKAIRVDEHGGLVDFRMNYEVRGGDRQGPGVDGQKPWC